MGSRSIRFKIILCIAIVFFLATSVTSWMAIVQQKKSVLDSAEKHAVDLADGYFDVLNTMMVTGVIANRAIARDKLLEHHEILAARAIRSEHLNAQYPSTREEERPQDYLDREALAQGKLISAISENENGRVLTIIKPAIADSKMRNNTPACVNCHLVKPGTVLGAVRIDFSLAERDAAEVRKQIVVISWNVGLFTLGLLVIYILLNRMVIKPIKTMQNVIGQVETGDLTQTMEIKSRDELGQIGRGINGIVSKLHEDIKAIQGRAGSLSQSSEELTSVAQQMAAGAEEVEIQAGSAAAATEDLSQNIGSMADSAQTITDSVQEIALSSQHVAQNMDRANIAARQTDEHISSLGAASEQMTATINEIAGSTERARVETLNAVGSVEKAARNIEELTKASKEIGEVIAAIEEIAELTTTLALNATIEAARAGSAGAGFAVVADEVRALAKQTNQATHEIQNRVDAIRETTELTVGEIRGIEGVIQQVNSMVDDIAAAVEEQSATTQENGENIGRVVDGMHEVSKRVSKTNEEISIIAGRIAEMATRAESVSENAVEAANRSQEVTRNINLVNRASSAGARGAEHVSQSAEDLNQTATHLTELVARFKV